MRVRARDARALVLGAVGAVAACAAATQQARDTITFSHHVHTEQGLGCTDCHDGVSRDAEQSVELMRMSGCGDCHDVESGESCGQCHTNVDAPDTYEEPAPTHLVFSHQLHEERYSDCSMCHEGAEHSPEVSPKRRMIPQHAECNVCHMDDMDSGRCRLCHERLDLNRREPRTIYSHGEGFFERHGLRAASGEEESCSVCHDQSFCGDCHAQTMTVRPSLRFPERVGDRSFVHEGDWLSRHVIEARVGDTGCAKCHGTSFCASCHERQGIGGASARRNPHPPGWLDQGVASSHSRAARRRIAECASCHDQGPASICLRCHSSGGVSPHPPGWKAPVDSSERSSHEMCSICHRN